MATINCMGCGACISVCNTDCIKAASVNDVFKNIHIEEDACVCCSACSLVCPENIFDRVASPLWYKCGTMSSNGGGGGGAAEGGRNSNGNTSGNGNWGDHAILPLNVGTLIDKNKNLKKKEMERLSQAIEEMNQDCYAKAIYDFLASNGYKFSSVGINPSLYGNAGFGFSTGSLSFQGEWAINSEAIFHEMFHLFQTKYGEGSFESNGMMEYERTIFTDIMFYVKYRGEIPYDAEVNRRSAWLDNGASAQESNEYRRDWLASITNKGTTVPLTISDRDFYKYAKVFKENTIAYKTNNFPSNYGRKALLKALSLVQNNCM